MCWQLDLKSVNHSTISESDDERIFQVYNMMCFMCSADVAMLCDTQVTMVRGPKGYGFKVSTGSPVYITEVHEGEIDHNNCPFVVKRSFLWLQLYAQMFSGAQFKKLSLLFSPRLFL